MLGLVVLLAYAVLAATLLPAWVVSMSGGKADENHRLDAIANARGALLGVLAPVVVAIGAVAAFLNYRIAATNLAETAVQNRRTYELSEKALGETQRQNRDTLDVTRRGQLTERFTRAIEQLGQTADDKLDIRLGAIYALERIAKESEELHQPVMEVLTAFLREHSQEPNEPSAAMVENVASPTTLIDPAPSERGTQRPRADFQAIVTVIGRRQVRHEPADFRLDLRGVVLDHVSFYRGHLEGANFAGAHLQGAQFNSAHLHHANFNVAHLQRALFWGAELHDAYFEEADVKGAQFGVYVKEGGLEEKIVALTRQDIRNIDIDEAFDASGLSWDRLDRARNVDQCGFLPTYLRKAREARPADPRRE